ncbi:T9SS type A sorting domain-containing protein [Fulvivirga lutea]|uniref:T9SS type A sorting domain-containing protein n=1 Tax=Fulvivirga lutea TaxID=2810512 RepID=A0A974WF07_9BACT|nr:T9SS type A sorting domain-containing protein [Fulvivirga lutea]QSE95857.1 T9SS type A sorting domain-containing protein [Fulvivirga lutea]
MTKILQSSLIILYFIGIAISSTAQDFTIAQNVTGNSNSTIRGQVFKPAIQEDGSGTITSEDAVYLTSFNVIYSGGTEAPIMYIYSSLPSTTANLDDGSGGVLVGESTTKTDGEFPYTNYTFDYLELDKNTTYYAVFRQNVELEFGGSGDAAGPYGGGKMLKNDGVNVIENDFAALKFVGEFNNNPIPHQSDVDALVALYNATDGDNWTNSWDINGNPYEWEGVSWDNSRVSRLYFYGNNLNGSLPEEIGNLTALKSLNIGNNNSLSGDIPSSIGNLLSLEYIDFFQTSISSIPPDINKLVNLVSLESTFSNITSLPEELFSLVNLTELNLFSNNLNGEIPTQIGELSNLIYLNLGNNDFNNATLTSEILKLTKLERLDLRGCSITNLPQNFSELTSLTNLNLSNNSFESIPDVIWELNQLTFLDLSNNDFSPSQFPIDIVNLTALKGLYLSNANLTGSIPVELSQMQTLTGIRLSDNELEGEILSTLSKIPGLYNLEISGNNFEEVIPNELLDLVNVQAIDISDNNFTGIFPSEFGSRDNFYQLDLSGNDITSIPDFSAAPSFYRLVIYNNRIEFGDIEKNITNSNIDFYYSPQKNLHVDTNMIIKSIGESVNLNVNVTGDNNLYQWFLNGTPVSDKSTSSDYVISSVSEADYGNYYCEITNAVVTDLTLRTEDIILSTPVEFTNSPTVIVQNALSLELETTVNKTGILYYLALPAGSSVPTEKQIIEGTNALDEIVANAANVVITKDEPIQFTISGLEINSSYDIFCVAVDGEGEGINTVMDNLTSSTTVGIEFIEGYPSLLTINATNIICNINTTRDGSIYYSVLDQGDAAPTAEQIKAGKNSIDDPAIFNGSQNILSETVAELTVRGLNGQTSYDIYLVAQDKEEFFSNVAKIQVETITSIDSPFSINELKVYPNPTNGHELNVIFTTNELFDIQIVSLEGKKMFVKKDIQNMTKLNLQFLEEGTYLINIKSNKRTGWIRFIKN